MSMDTVHTENGPQGSARAASVFSLGLGPFHAGRMGVSRSSCVKKMKISLCMSI